MIPMLGIGSLERAKEWGAGQPGELLRPNAAELETQRTPKASGFGALYNPNLFQVRLPILLPEHPLKKVPFSDPTCLRPVACR